MTEKSAAGLIRSEIEEKRLRVQKLRERRKELQVTQSPTLEAPASTTAASATTVKPVTRGRASTVSSASMEALLASIPGLAKPQAAAVSVAASVSASTSPAAAATSPVVPRVVAAVSPAAPAAAVPVVAKPKKTFSIATEVAVEDVPPIELLTYSKQTQTLSDASEDAGALGSSVGPAATSSTATPGRKSSISGLVSPSLQASRGRRRSGAFGPEQFLGSSSSMDQLPFMALPAPAAPQTQAQAVAMTPEECAAVMATGEFAGFVSRAGRVVERATSINERFPDIAADYASLLSAAGSAAPGEASSAGAMGRSRTAVSKLEDLADAQAAGRTVTCLAWSPQHDELLLAGFSAEAEATRSAAGETEGLVLVWSVPSALGRAEYSFTCQSEVMSAIFSPAAQQQPQSVIIGGTRSGQIVVWDMRAGQAPVLSRPPSKKTHTYPIYCLEAIPDDSGSSAAAAAAAALVAGSSQETDQLKATGGSGNSIASLSSDGKICIWSLRNLAQPVDSCDVQLNFRATEVTAMALPPFATSASANFVFGCDDGSISAYNAHSKMAIGTVEKAEGPAQHTGPILGIDFHPLPRGFLSSVATFDSLSRLFLSCSADWTVKLWSASPQAGSAAAPASSTAPRAVHSFPDSGDCVFDARWSPAHPAVFATGDGQGKLCVWDISAGLESPAVESFACSSGSPITRVSWNGRGSHIAAGDSRGVVHMFSVNERWQSSKTDDWVSLNDIIRKQKT